MRLMLLLILQNSNPKLEPQELLTAAPSPKLTASSSPLVSPKRERELLSLSLNFFLSLINQNEIMKWIGISQQLGAHQKPNVSLLKQHHMHTQIPMQLPRGATTTRHVSRGSEIEIFQNLIPSSTKHQLL